MDSHRRDFTAWFESLTVAELRALRTYQSSETAYGFINGILRGHIDPGRNPAAGRALSYLPHLDSAIAKGRTTEPLVVYRGLASAGLYAKLMIGDTVQERGYLSTSFDREVALSFASELLLEIEVPVGTPAALMGLLGRPGEAELLLARRTLLGMKAASMRDGMRVLLVTVMS